MGYNIDKDKVSVLSFPSMFIPDRLCRIFTEFPGCVLLLYHVMKLVCADFVFEMAKGRYYIRQDIKVCFSLYSLGLLSCNLLCKAYERHTLLECNLYNLGINNRLQLHVML